MVSGLSPRIKWAANPGGETRTIEEAVVIAEQNGIKIPDDIEFFPDNSADLGPRCVARAPRVGKRSGSCVLWSDLIHPRTNKVPVRVWVGVLKSDEAIVATFAHELFELEFLRPLMQEGRITIESFIEHTRDDDSRNLHSEAWDIADRAVETMRERKQKEDQT